MGGFFLYKWKQLILIKKILSNLVEEELNRLTQFSLIDPVEKG
jgi:hypothetical protein